MTLNTAFTIYNAAAGAGKTYTLVKAYIITLLKGEFKDSYKNILAITFTNKAVAEMKIRVLENLIAISSPQTPIKYQALIEELILETGFKEQQLKQKADKILKSILHNYAAFDIVTIDTFTHRVIRTFAHDLGIPLNFEIEMDTESLIEEAVDAVIAKIGIDDQLTQIIIDFAISKLEDDKSWDITVELNKVARLLFSENDREHLDKISDKSPEDFDKLKNILLKKITENKTNIVEQSNQILQLISEKGLENSDFTRSSIPNHFLRLAKGETNIDFTAAWKQNIQTTSFYNTKLDELKKNEIDSLRSTIEDIFLNTKQLLSSIHLFENVLKNLVPLSVLNAINQELQKIKKERRILLISEFNNIISSAIQHQPAPFIYERLGERYRDYFIDEFQDTSELQWNNIVPLIDNAIATETLTGKRGHLTIVGDAKQAIYRWRGGKAEQFINLSGDLNPFSVKEKQVLDLPKNYRSHREVVEFNNNLFSFLSKDFSDPEHANLYIKGNQQETNSKKEGYVNISFIQAKNSSEENEVYPQRVYEIISNLKEKGYKPYEICILVRKQKEGSILADFLTEKGLSIISSETLLISNAPEVVFIIDLLTWHTHPENLIAKAGILHFIAEHFLVEEKHSFLEKMIFSNKTDIMSEFSFLGIDFNFNKLALLPLYDIIEYIINSFKLANSAPAYLQFFLDVVFSFTQKHTEGIIGFLSYWNQKKDKLSIIAPEEEEAIRIMTIHKAKGLEFPCVIYPYANIDIYKELEPKTWLTVSKDDYNGFEEVFINYSKNISEYGEEASTIVSKRQSQLELDTFNLLYVALTRAEEQLFIVSKLELTAKGVSNNNKFSGKLINYLQHINEWNTEQTEYQFGNPNKPISEESVISETSQNIKLTKLSNSKQQYKVNIVTNSGKLWDTTQEAAIEKGNLLHELLSKVYTPDDIATSVEDAYHNGLISFIDKNKLSQELERIVKHPDLIMYFSKNNTILNEKEIIANGRFYRPDRIVIESNNVITILDYKTGAYQESHANQIKQYAILLQKMGYILNTNILVYINENIALKLV
ncbi:UvrD-helicase domain-containing protein [Aquimarina sp. 2201CG5-10]|uniref:UvrD-helicase domain-containing protein n=1 Tax=Aquimarina callyspongiae TaxID=3098150 RepID=UPI002AB35536|nr:UvrD-helicase domain-containing protein [Aquimarina sp. 2201CG5-10]MDY8135123.1 UvrD-helicase domain-containing protein [Aquimarina sp. 2201CG5-10]